MKNSPSMIIVEVPQLMQKVRRAIAVGSPECLHSTVFIDLFHFIFINGIVSLPPLVLPNGARIDHLREEFIVLADKLGRQLPPIQRIELQLDSHMADTLIFLITKWE